MDLVSTTHTNSKAMPINYNDYGCHNSCRTCLTNRMESISCHIMPLVINSLRRGHTDTLALSPLSLSHARTHTHTHTHTILTNQVHTSLWSACAWFKKLLKIQQCKPASRNSYKTLAKILFQL